MFNIKIVIGFVLPLFINRVKHQIYVIVVNFGTGCHSGARLLILVITQSFSITCK